MGEPHVISALVRKRAELAGEIEAAQGRAAQLRSDLLHLDAVIMLFDPTMVPGRIAAKRKRTSKQNHWFGPGELARSVLDTLRAAGAPLSIAEVAERIMARKGLDAGDKRVRDAIDSAVGGYLRRRRPAVVERIGDRRGLRWRVAG